MTSSHFSHIEVISSDARMPDFLNNPGQVTSGQKFIRLHPEADLYTRSGSGEQSVFTKTETKTPKDSTKILRVADCSPFEDAQHQTWFKVSGHSWMNQSGIDQINQYDLKERGFSPLEQDASPDVSKSLRENWVKGAYDWLSAQVGQAQGIHEKQVSAFYKAMVKKTDSDGDGQLTGRELYNALHHPEAGVRDIAARLVVKHDSEWFGGSSHHRWSVFFQNYDRLRMAYARQWLDDCEWMSKVEAFRSGAPVWHFHPVMFLDALNNMSLPVTPVNGKLEPLDFITFYKGDSIDDADYQLAATSLSCEVAAIKAVAQTETGNYGSYFKFQSDDDYVPAILFERHHFSKYTHGAYDSQTDISNSDAGGYGAISTQYPKLVRAYALNKRAALMSASWGKFQILGSNYAAAGYSSPEAFVMAMSESEKNQLKAFVAFIKFDATLLTSIRNKDWLTFARAYNGKKQKGYDKKM
ncbi:N-acetylmuramidase family protein [Lelliottia amnigena]|uniref:N-acetylmuramidase family protein n=1 Tax=Lelliottia amnigena TaxID=61646 RepID=UPI003080138B